MGAIPSDAPSNAPAGETDPLELLALAYRRAAVDAPFDVASAALATADGAGRPSVRIVLVKNVDPRGLPFYTNYESRKGGELAANPRAAICFYWPWIEEQVRAEGAVERLSEEESDAYFAARPRGHQLGAWASKQSATLGDRAELERRIADLDRRFAASAVPRPRHWGGFLLRPDRLEFWRGRADRLHERRLFERARDGWHERLLYP